MMSSLAVFTFVTCMVFSVGFLGVGSSNASALERPGRVAVHGQVPQPTAFRTHELFTAQIAQSSANAQKSRQLVIFFHGIRGGGVSLPRSENRGKRPWRIRASCIPMHPSFTDRVGGSGS